MRSWLSPWLARLSFSFFILAGLLLWESHKAIHGELGPISPGRIALFWIGALCSAVIGFLGVRERHRQRWGDDPGNDLDRPQR